jgi:hypothetical protein
MKPKYTDAFKYLHGYQRSEATDIRKTFARVRSELKAKSEQEAKDEAERKLKVEIIRRRA